MKRNYEISFDEKLHQRLQQLAAKEGISLSDLIRKSLALYSLIDETMSPGGHIFVADKGDNIEAEIDIRDVVVRD